MRLSGSRFIFLIGFLYFSTAQAQDQSNFTQFYTNPYLINSSYVGLDGQSSASLIYRKQWMNISGAPQIANFSLQTPINTKMSGGLSVTNDSRGLFDNTSLLFTYGYHVALQNQMFVRFGISLGGTWNSVDLDKLETVTDRALAKMLDNNASLAGNAGISFQSKMFHLGVSMPAIFSPSYVSQDAFSIAQVKPFQNLIINASNRFYIAKGKHIFEPYLIYRLNNALPGQFEGAGVFHINHLIWLGGSYKQNFGIAALGGVKIKNIFAIGGAYTFQNTGVNQLSSPSFEITLNYLFGKHKKGSFVYSFVNTDREKKVIHPTTTTTHPAIAKQEPHKTEPAKTPVKQQPAKQPVKTAPVIAKNEPVKTEPVKTEPVKTEPVKTDPVKTDPVKTEPVKTTPTVTIKEGHPEHEEEQLKRLETHADNPNEHHDGTVEHPHAERHEFVKRGNHEKELDVADYVVGGVFGNEANAKKFSDGLDKLGFDTHYGHLTAKNLWYVYVIKTDDLEKAKAYRDKVRKTKLLRDSWLLTVHH